MIFFQTLLPNNNFILSEKARRVIWHRIVILNVFLSSSMKLVSKNTGDSYFISSLLSQVNYPMLLKSVFLHLYF